ncbi:hypothetical protein C6P46_001407 [Rhodotorula mucilaginosa]|uniref:Uncharacterized protein n=1 Tax=Rhodotorula mucilaginosa TaxID=5537 RepID=A0A9P7B2E2_RHOMI|nr:hypothetical protein C6P46_001407 [Rhodotorula mucilaginosa]
MSSTVIKPVRRPLALNEAYLAILSRRPILTKAGTGGLLYYLSELVSTGVAQALARGRRRTYARAAALSKSDDPARARSGICAAQTHLNALKLALYAPLDHALYELLARVFRGRTSVRARITEVVAALAIILPIQNTVYLSALSVIHGSIRQVSADVRSELLPITRISAVIQTLSLLFAQKFLPQPAWTPFFTGVASMVDTFINVKVKVHAGSRAKTA